MSKPRVVYGNLGGTLGMVYYTEHKDLKLPRYVLMTEEQFKEELVDAVLNAGDQPNSYAIDRLKEIEEGK